MFTTALNDLVITAHPCRGVKTPTVAVKEYRILTPTEIGRLLIALPCDPARLVVDTLIGSGLRWGELTELRPRDLRSPSGILTVTRAAVELNPAGGRFLIKDYPKSTHSRRFRLDPTLITAIRDHIATHSLGADDLLFPLHTFTTAAHRATDTHRATDDGIIDNDDAAGEAPDLARDATASTNPHADLELTEPNRTGRRYRHATLSAYTAGACRCPPCRHTFATYRATRRATGADQPRGTRPAPTDTEGHLSRNWWRTKIWYPTCRTAQLDPRPRTHDLRHSHASWLLAGGADLETVRERLGHASITTTGKYVHTLPTADDTALTAYNRIRNGT